MAGNSMSGAAQLLKLQQGVDASTAAADPANLRSQALIAAAGNLDGESGGSALLKGVLTGAGIGQAGVAAQNQSERAQKYQKVIDYMVEQQGRLDEAEAYQKAEQLKQEKFKVNQLNIQPALAGYLQTAKRVALEDPTLLKQRAQSLVNAAAEGLPPMVVTAVDVERPDIVSITNPDTGVTDTISLTSYLMDTNPVKADVLAQYTITGTDEARAKQLEMLQKQQALDQGEATLEKTQTEVERLQAQTPKTPEQEAFDKERGKQLSQQLAEAEAVIREAPSIVKTLNDALNLSKDAFDGLTAESRAEVLQAYGIDGAVKYGQLKQLLTEQALSQLRTIFGGNPTEGERKILLDMQGIGGKSQETRDALIKQTQTAIQNRINTAVATRDQIQSGAPAAAPAYREGQTATNPTTGQRMEFRGGQWQDL